MLDRAPKQKVSGDYDRRWMSDDYFDLIVWYTGKDVVRGFQLCYGKPYWERALTWLSDRGFSHTAVEGGEEGAEANRTPILVPDGSFPADEVKQEFQRRAIDLPVKLRELVMTKIVEFESHRPK
jgi:hypothetical protein